MPDNITFLGNWADGYDRLVAEDQAFLDSWVDEGHYTMTRMVTASTLMAFAKFSQPFVDTLRLGNGVRSGTLRGVGSDALRLLNVVGAAGAAIGRVSKLLAVSQAGGTVTCTWISAANALQRTGNRFFASIADLADAAGVDLKVIAQQGGSMVPDVNKLYAALRGMGVTLKVVAPVSSDLNEVVDLAKANPNGVVAFAIKYISNGKYCGHSIFASFSRAEGLIISDTFNEGSLIPTARIYRSLAELAKEYAGASQLGFPMAVIENSTIITGASNAATAGGFGNLFLQVVRVAQPAVTGPAGPPRDSRQGAPAAW